MLWEGLRFVFSILQLKIFGVEFRQIGSDPGFALGRVIAKATAFVQFIFCSAELTEHLRRVFPRRGKKAVPALGIFFVVP